jgi:hypothetical protein
VICQQCKKNEGVPEHSSTDLPFCSLDCRLNWNIRKIDETFKNHKEEIEKSNRAVNNNNKYFFYTMIVLLATVCVLSSGIYLLILENNEQDERLIRWMEHQREIESKIASNSHKLCSLIEPFYQDVTCDFIEDMNRFEWRNP